MRFEGFDRGESDIAVLAVAVDRDVGVTVGRGGGGGVHSHVPVQRNLLIGAVRAVRTRVLLACPGRFGGSRAF